MEKLPIEIDPSSYVDPNGFLFHHNDALYRGIYPHVEGFYRSLFDSGTIKYLQENHSLVPSRIVEFDLPGIDCNLVLEHEAIWPLSYCVEWCPSMLQNAARNLLEMSLELIERQCLLQDAYPWNTLFRGARPVFVDFTSIVEINTPLIWPAYLQFKSFFLRPLQLSAMGKGKIARALLFNNIDGIPFADFYSAANILFKLRRPWSMLENWLDRRVQESQTLRKKLKTTASTTSIQTGPEVRHLFFKGLLKKVNRFHFGNKADVWNDYYETIDTGVDKESKLRTVETLLARIKPKTVLDLGCNTGVFSLIAAEQGALVVSIDSSESCVETLYQEASSKGKPITPLIGDVLCPTPAYGFLGCQYPALHERVRSELVMCLALMHHLHISGRQSFERIAALMDYVSEKHLIFEFVAMDDANISLLNAPREIDYTLKTVLDTLYRYFTSIDILDSDRPTRKILACTK